MSPFSVITFFVAIITTSLTVSREIGPSASYYSPWDPVHHTQTATVDVEDPKFASLTKTGTTIVGISCRDGVVLGADTRSTGGPLVMDKNKLKIHIIASRIFCCAAGTSADCDQITRKASHELQLLRLERELCGEDYLFDPIQAALISVTDSLDKAPGGRKPSSVMILGGIDDAGPALYIIDELLKEGAIINVYDPEAMNNVKEIMGNKITFCERQYDTLANADILVIATEWSEFRTPDFDKIISLLKNKVIFDGRNLFDLKQMEELGFYYVSIGRRTVNQLTS